MQGEWDSLSLAPLALQSFKQTQWPAPPSAHGPQMRVRVYSLPATSMQSGGRGSRSTCRVRLV